MQTRSHTLSFTLLVMISVLLFVADAKFQVLQGMRQTFQSVLSPIRQAAIWPQSMWDGFSNTFQQKQALLAHTQALQQQITQQQLQIQQLQASLQKTAQLKALLKLQKTHPLTFEMTRLSDQQGYLSAQWLYAPVSSSVSAQTAVLSAQGVVGQVTAVHDKVATILPIVNAKSAVPVENTRLGIRAIAQGTGQNGLVIRHILKNAKLQVGAVFNTSGLGGVFPAGFAVGTVTAITPSQNHLFLTVRLRPSVNIARLTYLALTRVGAAHA